MQKKLKIIAGAGVALVASGGAALAATTPDPAQDGLGRASEVTGIELPASQESHPTADDHPGGAPEAETVEVDVAEDESTPTENHGASVSAVARDESTTGAEHGEAVSTVARQNGAAHAEGRGRP